MPGEFRKREIIGDRFVVTYTVDDAHSGVRADQFLKTRYRRKSRAELQRAISDGKITIKGKNLKSSTILHPGDELQIVSVRNTDEPGVSFDYKVLFEDDYAIVIDKPGNLPIHPAGRFVFNTLLTILREDRKDWIREHDRNSDFDQDFYLIHRLDRETSGIVILAKQKFMATKLIDQFFNRETQKKYYAITSSLVSEDSFTVDADIGPATGSDVRLKMQAYDRAKSQSLSDDQISLLQPARTDFKVLKRTQDKTLLDCTLHSGRQHQIRVHLAYRGIPVFGDKLYGSRPDLFLKYIDTGIFTPEMHEALGFHRHALHSRYLKFFHPVRNEWIEIESPLPDDMAALI